MVSRIRSRFRDASTSSAVIRSLLLVIFLIRYLQLLQEVRTEIHGHAPADDDRYTFFLCVGMTIDLRAHLLEECQVPDEEDDEEESSYDHAGVSAYLKRLRIRLTITRQVQLHWRAPHGR